MQTWPTYPYAEPHYRVHKDVAATLKLLIPLLTTACTVWGSTPS